MYTFNSISQRFTDGRGVARPRRTRVADAIVADDARITRRRDRCHRRALQPPELIRISARRRARAGRSTAATGTRLPFPAGIYALAVTRPLRHPSLLPAPHLRKFSSWRALPGLHNTTTSNPAVLTPTTNHRHTNSLTGIIYSFIRQNTLAENIDINNNKQKRR